MDSIPGNPPSIPKLNGEALISAGNYKLSLRKIILKKKEKEKK